MQTDNRLFDDLAKVASGAIHTFGGVRDEVETRVRERFERLANEMGFVTREEFEATKAMAQRARLEQEELVARFVELEAKVAAAATAGSDSSHTASSSKIKKARTAQNQEGNEPSPGN